MSILCGCCILGIIFFKRVVMLLFFWELWFKLNRKFIIVTYNNLISHNLDNIIHYNIERIFKMDQSKKEREMVK